MSRFGVSHEKERALLEKMARLGIKDHDLEEKFIRSGGHGGQNVNKVATCVMLLHVPSGIQVKVQQERSQALNRFFARRLLVEKLETKILGAKSERLQAAEKIRRQKRKRSKRAKAKMMDDKSRQSEKKRNRSVSEE